MNHLERTLVLQDRAVDLAEKASLLRDEFRWWATIATIGFSLAVLAATSQRDWDLTTRLLMAGGLASSGLAATFRAIVRRREAAMTWSQAREAFDAVWRRIQ